MITLYHAAPSRSSVVYWMLEEIGEAFHLRVLDLKKGEQKSPAYRAVNPMGKVPAIEHDGVIITEVAAICCYLADAFPEAGLAPAVGDKRRGPYLKWLFFAPGCLEPAIIDRAFPRADAAPTTALGYGSFDAPLDLIAQAVGKGRYLLDEQLSAADVVIGSTLRWGMLFKMLPERPEFTAYVGRLAERPAFQRATAKDAELAAVAGRAPRFSRAGARCPSRLDARSCRPTSASAWRGFPGATSPASASDSAAPAPHRDRPSSSGCRRGTCRRP